MLYTVIKKNSYQDSINLMLLSTHINTMDQVVTSQVMMGTDANKEILRSAGLLSEDAQKASPNDMIIAFMTSDSKGNEEVLEEIDKFLGDLSVKKQGEEALTVDNWQDAIKEFSDGNLALFSIPGEYGYPEMEKALKEGYHVFSFTDNISLEDELKLKELADEKGLLMMGPDCGTGMISGTPLGFTNAVAPGNISIVGASGTGVQEVMSIVDLLGGGIIHAIGTGGRDLRNEIGARTVKKAIAALEHHDLTEVLVVISKPPSKELRDEVVGLLQSSKKKVVAIFLGEKPESHLGNVYLAHTLEEAAEIAVDLSRGKKVKGNYSKEIELPGELRSCQGGVIKGLYSGGTLASEAAMLIADGFQLGELISEEGYLLKANGHEVMDLGDDFYTQGRPHPMIDPYVRTQMIEKMAKDPQTGVILFDVVLGYGCHESMAEVLRPAIEKAKSINPNLVFVASVVGTKLDPQNYEEQVSILKSAGVFVASSNAQAVFTSMKILGVDYEQKDKDFLPYEGDIPEMEEVGDDILSLLHKKPKVINIGVESFTESIKNHGGEVLQYHWRPRAGGNKKMIKILDALEELDEEIKEHNWEVIEKYRDSQPFLMDVRPAKEVIPELNTQEKTLLHAGPPIGYDEMTGPMQGSCVGALLFEKWAEDEETAREILEKGKIRFIPCHHVNAVGPMGGITSPNMPMFVVENKLDGTESYCIMNEGIGKVLRFGAYSQEVIDRLHWMKEVLGPTLSKALKSFDEGLNLSVIVAKSITMGDEFHQRNIAASLNFLKEMAGPIVKLDMEEDEKHKVIDFLAKTDQFFLNIMMAMSKSMADCARKGTRGTIVTAMTRNGKDFGVRIAETGDIWYKAPVNTPKGLYFTGYSEEDGNKDIGDSAITETVGVGGMAMVAAPGVTRFVGAGGFDDALRISNEMEKICVSHNPNWPIATWDYKGALLGIDIRKVVETQITPIINTGIAHKEAGKGQVGAGTVLAPLACFEKALIGYAKARGIEVD